VIEELGQLTELNIYGTKVTNFTPLRKLNKLKKLSLHETLISDRSVFRGMDHLVDLDLTGTDLEPLAAGYLRNVSGRDQVREIYRQPGGKVIGEVSFNPQTHDTNYRSPQILIKVNGENIVNFTRDKMGSGWVYEDIYYLKYYGEQDGYVRILASTLNQPVFIKLKNDNTIKTITWIEDLVERGGGSYIHGYGGHDLKIGPSNLSSTLVKLSEQRHKITKFTGKINGAWAEANVVEVRDGLDACYSEEDLKAFQTGKTWTGWIKLVDDNGQPNNIQHAGGC
jgi:hypothetical protein